MAEPINRFSYELLRQDFSAERFARVLKKYGVEVTGNDVRSWKTSQVPKEFGDAVSTALGISESVLFSPFDIVITQ